MSDKNQDAFSDLLTQISHQICWSCLNATGCSQIDISDSHSNSDFFLTSD